MKTLTKPAAKKTIARGRVACTHRDLPAIPTTSPMHGHDSAVGCVSIAVPQSATARRALIRARIHADNHR